MTLMCDFELDKRAVEKKYGIEFEQYFSGYRDVLQELEDDDCVTVTDDAIQVSDIGRLVIRNIAMAFDAYLPKQMSAKPLFSKTV